MRAESAVPSRAVGAGFAQELTPCSEGWAGLCRQRWDTARLPQRLPWALRFGRVSKPQGQSGGKPVWFWGLVAELLLIFSCFLHPLKV